MNTENVFIQLRLKFSPFTFSTIAVRCSLSVKSEKKNTKHSREVSIYPVGFFHMEGTTAKYCYKLFLSKRTENKSGSIIVAPCICTVINLDQATDILLDDHSVFVSFPTNVVVRFQSFILVIVTDLDAWTSSVLFLSYQDGCDEIKKLYSNYQYIDHQNFCTTVASFGSVFPFFLSAD